MASGLLIEQEDRAGDNSSASFEADDLFTPDAIRGGAYLAARYGLGVFVSLGNMLVMTRWIGPHAYGLFVTAIGIVAFLSNLARAGVDIYLVRLEPAPDRRICDIAITLVLFMSAALSLLGAVSVPLLIRWFHGSEFVKPYFVLLLTIPVTSMTGIAMAKLERELNFRSVARIELGGQTAGLVISAILAGSAFGVWAPVAGQFAWQVYVLIATSAATRMVPRITFDLKEARAMLSFGIGFTSSMRVWQLRTLVNPLLVGRFAGADGVAFVALAVRIAEALGTLRLAAGRMAIAALARLQDKREQFRIAVERASLLQVMTQGPLLFAFSLAGPLIVRHVIGVRWMPILLLYPFVAAGVLVNSVYNLQASALFVMGRHWTVMRSYTLHVTVLGAGTLLLLPRLGISGYGWAELLACGGYFILHSALKKAIGFSYKSVLPCASVFLLLLFITA
jgi:O-antigen/teichoic acid export membrane protein